MTKNIFKSTMLVCALVLAVGLVAVMGILYNDFDGQMREELSKEALYLAYGVDQQGVDYLKNIKDKNARITYIDQDGTVLYDNKADAAEMENHSDRKEFQKAEKYGVGESSRYSDTLSEKTIYYAQRLKDGTVLRVSGTQDSVLALVENLVLPLVLVLFLMLILSGIMASVISKRIVKPVNELDLEHPEENQIYEELSPLLSKIHRQNREIQNQLELAKQQQAEYIGKEAAAQLALSSSGVAPADAKSMTTDLDSRSGTDYYRVAFSTDNGNYEYMIDAVTGVVIESQTPGAENSAQKDQSDDAKTSDSGSVSASGGEASASGTSDSGYGSAKNNTGSADNSGQTANGSNSSDKNTASNQNSSVSPSGSAISAARAKQLALAQVPGASESDLREFEVDYDDGRMEYEGKIYYNGMEYEFEIDAYSGAFRSWEVEPIHD